MHHFVWGTVHTIEEGVSDIVETFGHLMEDGLQGLSSRGFSMSVAFVLQWMGAVVSSGTDLLAGILKGGMAIVVGIIAGILLTLWGLLSGHHLVVQRGLWVLLGGVAGGVLLILGKVVAVVNTFFHLQAFARSMTDTEKEKVRRVFGDSIALYNVRLVEGYAGLLHRDVRAFVLGNTIYLKQNDLSVNDGLLIHECTHVWQYQQRGASYIGYGLGAQWLIPQTYRWEREIEQGNQAWVNFNLEAQGQFFEDVWNQGMCRIDGQLMKGKGVFFQNETEGVFQQQQVNYTDVVHTALHEVRQVKTHRLSTFIGF